MATALGSLCGGVLSELCRQAGLSGAAAYRPVVLAYAAMGILLAALFGRLSAAVEIPAKSDAATTRFGLHRSQRVVWKLSGLFALDAFAGGFVIQSFLAYWFHVRYGVGPELLMRSSATVAPAASPPSTAADTATLPAPTHPAIG